MTIDTNMLGELIKQYGLPLVLVGTFVWLLYTRRLRWNGEYEDLKANALVIQTYLEERVAELLAERNEFKEMVITSQRLAGKSMDTLSEVTAITKQVK